MFIIFNKDGSIFAKTQSDYVMQGSNKVNKIFVGFTDNNYVGWSCNGVFNLPNGTRWTIPAIPLTGGFEYLGVSYQGWSIELTSDVTMYDGVVESTIQLVSDETNVLFTYLFNITVNRTGIPLDGHWDSSITVAQFNSYMAQLAVKLQANTVSVVVNENELPAVGTKNVLYFLIGETSNTPYQVKMWNGSEYTLLGTVNLSTFASKEEQLEFEEEINNQVEQIRGEVTNPFVVVDSTTNLPSTNQNKLYIVRDTNAWYYWNGTAYVVGNNVIPPIIQASDVAFDDDSTQIEAGTVQQAIEALDSEKANKDGYYQEMRVAFADNLASPDGITQEATLSFRASGGTASITDGFAEIKAIKGRTLIVNQLVNNDNWSITGGTLAEQDGVFTITLSNTPTADYSTRIYQRINYRANNVYLIKFGFYSSKTGSIIIDSNGKLTSTIVQYNTANTWQEYNLFINGIATANDNYSIYPRLVESGYVAGDTYQLKNIRIINLTQMFGAGHEPSTVAEFNNLTRYLDTDTYNEGTPISSEANKIVSVGFNAFDGELEIGYIDVSTGSDLATADNIRSKNYIPVVCGETYTLYSDTLIEEQRTVYFYDKNFQYIGYKTIGKNITLNLPNNCCYIRFRFKASTLTHNICFHLTHSGYRNGQYEPYWKETRELPTRKYFPDGMKSAENAYDLLTPTKARKVIGSVDLGTLNWIYLSDYKVFISTDLQNVLIKASDNSQKNYSQLSDSYGYWLNRQSQSSQFDNDPKDISVSISNNGNLQLRNLAYTDATTFKQAMSGVILNYELAEPIETDVIDSRANDWFYRVSDFGTESANPFLRAEIFYMNNLRDKLRNLPDIPKCEDTTGTSVLKCVNGTYTWVKEE